MGRKLTNKEMTKALVDLNSKIEFFCTRTQSVLSHFIDFLDKGDDFKEYLDDKYSKAKEQDTKKSK
jgi:hypothetical protein